MKGIQPTQLCTNSVLATRWHWGAWPWCPGNAVEDRPELHKPCATDLPLHAHIDSLPEVTWLLPSSHDHRALQALTTNAS